MTTRGILNVPAGQMNPAAALSQLSAGKGCVSFGSVMKTQLNNTVGNDNTAVKTEAKSTQKSQSPAETRSEAKANTSKTEVKEAGSVNQTTETETTAKAAVDEVAEKPAVQTGDEMPDDAELKVLSEAVAALMVQMAELLEISPEELQSQLEAIGAEPVDLLDPETTLKLVMNLDGLRDTSELLLNGESTEKLTELTELVKDFKTELAERMELEPKELNEALEKLDSSEAVKKEITEKVEIIITDERTVRPLKNDVSSVKTDEAEGDGPEEAKAVNENVKSLENSKPEAKENQDGAENGTEHSAETERADSGIRRESTPAESRPNPAETFIQNLERAAGTSEVQELQPEAVTMRDIVYQLSEQIRVTVTDTHQSMEMTLNPESLGKVFMNITNRDGVMTASFTTENQIAREAIESQLQILKNNIEAQGIRVEAIEVTVSDFNFAQSSNKQNGDAEQQQNGRSSRVGSRRNLNLNDAELNSSELNEEERIAAEVMEQNGNTVDYMA